MRGDFDVYGFHRISVEYYKFSLDEETIEDYQKPQETELVEEKQSKPVDEDKSVISDKTLIALEG